MYVSVYDVYIYRYLFLIAWYHWRLSDFISKRKTIQASARQLRAEKMGFYRFSKKFSRTRSKLEKRLFS